MAHALNPNETLDINIDGLTYVATHLGQRVIVIANRRYPNTHVGKVGTITARYDGIDIEHGTVEVKLDDEFYLPPSPSRCEHTHMGVDQLAAI